jgi:hypothetical protein
MGWGAMDGEGKPQTQRAQSKAAATSTGAVVVSP